MRLSIGVKPPADGLDELDRVRVLFAEFFEGTDVGVVSVANLSDEPAERMGRVVLFQNPAAGLGHHVGDNATDPEQDEHPGSAASDQTVNRGRTGGSFREAVDEFEERANSGSP